MKILAIIIAFVVIASFLLPKIIPFVVQRLGSQSQLSPTAHVNTSNNTVTIKDKETTISVGQNVSLPGNFPVDIPQYPDAKIIQSYSPAQDQAIVVWTAKDTSIDMISGFYKTKMTENSWVQTESDSQSQATFSKYKKGSREAQVVLTPPQSQSNPLTKDAVMITISY